MVLCRHEPFRMLRCLRGLLIIVVTAFLAGAAGCAGKTETYASAEGGYALPVPAGWKVKPQGGGQLILHAAGADAGGLDILGRKPGPDPEYLPNHSRELDRRVISTPAGPGRVFTLERSLPAASGDPRVWREQHAFIPAGDRVYDLWVKVGPQESGEPVPPLGAMLAGFRLTKAVSGVVVAETPAGALGRLAFVRDGDIWVRPLPRGKPVRITHDGRNTSPRWSPSGRWLAFQKVFYEEQDLGSGRKYRYAKESELWVMRDSGAGARRVAPGSAACRSWSPKADTLAYADGEGIWTVTAAEDLEKPRKVLADAGLGCPAWSPDGRGLAYVVHHDAVHTRPADSPGRYDVLGVAAADGSQRRELISTAAAVYGLGIVPAGWSGDGKKVMYWPQPMFSSSLLADGTGLEAVPSQGGKAVSWDVGMLAYPDSLAWSPRGDVLAVIDGGGRESWTGKRLALVDAATGKKQRELTGAGEAAAAPAWSPDGRRLAYVAGPDAGPVGGGALSFEALAARRVWIADLDSGKRRRLTDGEAYREERPLWGPGGSHVLFVRVDREDRASLWLFPAGGGIRVQVAELAWDPAADPSENLWGFYGHVAWDKLFDWWRGPGGGV